MIQELTLNGEPVTVYWLTTGEYESECHSCWVHREKMKEQG